MDLRRTIAVVRFLAVSLALGGASALAGAAEPAVPALMEKYGCTICHSDRETMAGPAWVDVAAHYRHDAHAPAHLAAVIKRGVHGAGPWPMPPLPQVPDADAKRMVRYILAQKR